MFEEILMTDSQVHLALTHAALLVRGGMSTRAAVLLTIPLFPALDCDGHAPMPNEPALSADGFETALVALLATEQA